MSAGIGDMRASKDPYRTNQDADYPREMAEERDLSPTDQGINVLKSNLDDLGELITKLDKRLLMVTNHYSDPTNTEVTGTKRTTDDPGMSRLVSVLGDLTIHVIEHKEHILRILNKLDI